MGPIVSLQACGLSGHHTLPEVDADFNEFHMTSRPGPEWSMAHHGPVRAALYGSLSLSLTFAILAKIASIGHPLKPDTSHSQRHCRNRACQIFAGAIVRHAADGNPVRQQVPRYRDACIHRRVRHLPVAHRERIERREVGGASTSGAGDRGSDSLGFAQLLEPRRSPYSSNIGTCR